MWDTLSPVGTLVWTGLYHPHWHYTIVTYSLTVLSAVSQGVGPLMWDIPGPVGTLVWPQAVPPTLTLYYSDLLSSSSICCFTRSWSTDVRYSKPGGHPGMDRAVPPTLALYYSDLLSNSSICCFTRSWSTDVRYSKPGGHPGMAPGCTTHTDIILYWLTF